MVIQPRKTTLAYRCPHCGTGVMSAVGMFSFGGADMIKLKCDCGKSELTAVDRKDGSFRLSVPCILCGQSHSYNLNRKVFFEKDLFTLSCPYSDHNIAFLGEMNNVKAELSRSELELLDLMEQSGIKDFDAFHNDEEALPDPEIQQIVMFVINDLDAEGKIYCKCPSGENGRDYDVEVTDEGIRVTCRKCRASRVIPTDSRLGAHAFLNADALYLE